MTTSNLLTLVPLVLLTLSAVPAVLIFMFPERAVRPRIAINITAATTKVLLVAALIPFILDASIAPELRFPFLPGVDLVLRVDSLSLLFTMLSALLWLVTTIYAIGYLDGRPNRRRFFGFFALCVTATVGIAFAGNLVTFLLFYEMLSLVTYPLVAHYGTVPALKAARLYLYYALGGGLLFLTGTVWLTALIGPVEFSVGGVQAVADLAAEQPGVAAAIFCLFVAGLGVKAALFPFHGWLPRAMVAPAPVSALLHAVAVVKAGAFGLIRIIDDLYGVQVASSLGVLKPLLFLAAFTVIYGSVRALLQEDIKKRLAYSTVSQVSYIALGLSMLSVTATTGGLVHLVHQGLSKITLFFCAGLAAEVWGIKKISQLDGLGKRMPLTSAAFTVGALSMIGIPPMAGFITKWQLGTGAINADESWVVGVLISSALLNAAYFLPVVIRMWFREPAQMPDGPVLERTRAVLEAPPALLWPAVTTAVFALAVGLFAGVPYSPLDVASYLAERVYQ
ncbi:proton-conducting transporter transmembrane domain-containing protein [Kocuria sp.]|uniref:proton-conducting transporter transmembrane domain-containing protein n=1 Tax=Kocuria sp. TaxID=1871328 RepID=UPI0026E00F87|nr:proton-conducting transporter membrane subunit [Kocuria sp.]MDO5619614.1 proton-conducting transporter membrane subunit [Kocuria sp.]